MSINLLVYPQDFPATVSNAGIGLTLQSAVQSIDIQSRDTALREAYNHRTAGQNEIENQNQLTGAVFRLMPLHYIRPGIPLPPPILGTNAFLGGGRGHESTGNYMIEFPFSNEIFNPINSCLTEYKIYNGTISCPGSGKYAGGYDATTGIVSQGIDKLTFANKQIQRTSATLSSPRYGLAGGMGTSTTGIFAGGINGGTYVTTKDVQLYNHPTDTAQLIANVLPRAKFPPHNGLTSPVAGYVWAGIEVANIVNTIDKISYSTLTSGIICSSIPTVPPLHHIIHAAFGNKTQAYLSCGSETTPAGSYWFGGQTTKFTFSGETAVIISSQLSNVYTCSDGFGHNKAGFRVGGDSDRPSSNWNGTTSADKLPYDTETWTPIGATLPRPLADQGATADYSAGWS